MWWRETRDTAEAFITLTVIFLFHWDKSIYLEVTHFPSLCLGEATQPCRWQRHLHSWGEPSGAPFNHHFYPLFNPDRNHNSQTNQSDLAAALGQLSRPCSPPVKPTPALKHFTFDSWQSYRPRRRRPPLLRASSHPGRPLQCRSRPSLFLLFFLFFSPSCLPSASERESDWAVKIESTASSLQATVRSPAGSSHKQEGTGTELSFSSPHENECVSARWSVCVWVRARTPSDLHQVSATVLIS